MMPLAGSERRLDTAVSAFAYEATTNTVIYSYNPDVKVSPGSLAKIVTALLAIELCDLDEVVTVNTSNIARLPAGSLNQNIKNGEELTINDLLHCLLLQSANDAAVVLAEHISGNMQGFTTLMNARVKQMGCTSTEFGDVHGLNDDISYTTARDMAKIVIEATKNETFKELFGAKTYVVPATNKSEERDFDTLNYLIDDSIITKYYDDRVTGGMVSHSSGAGASLVCTAQKGTNTDKKSDDLNLVCVVLGCTREYASNGWQVTYYGNFDEMTELLDYVFNTYKVNRILYDGQALNQFSVIGGECEVVGGPQVNYDTVLPADCQMDNLIKKYSVTGGSLTAPVNSGDMIATVQLWYRNSCVAEAELFALGSVKTSSSSASIEGMETGNSKSGGAMKVLTTVCLVILIPVAGYLAINSWRRYVAKTRRRRRRASRRRSR